MPVSLSTRCEVRCHACGRRVPPTSRSYSRGWPLGVKRVAGCPAPPEVVYWRIVFAILSVHTSFEANEAAYLELRKDATLPSDFTYLAALLAQCKGVDGSVVQFAGQKARYLLDFDTEWNANWCGLMPNGDKHQGWRDRLDGLRGLARMKASFAVCLSDPLQSEVICIDRHMAALLIGGEGVRERQLRKGEYDAGERRILRLARVYDAPPFAVQCSESRRAGNMSRRYYFKLRGEFHAIGPFLAMNDGAAREHVCRWLGVERLPAGTEIWGARCATHSTQTLATAG